MQNNGYTVIMCEFDGGVPSNYTCSDDTGDIKYVPASVMRRLIAERPGFIRNLTLDELEPPYARFPLQRDGNLAGTVLCCGTGDTGKLFRVVGQRIGNWYMDDISEEEAIARIRRGLIVNASISAKKVFCTAPVRQDILFKCDAPTAGNRVDTVLLYVTEASGENGNKLRYAGVEFSGTNDVIDTLLPSLNEKSLLLRKAYYDAFGRSDDALMLQNIPGKIFVVLPYADIEKLLASAKRTKISRVIVSSCTFRGGSIFDESRVVLSGVLGSSEVRGSRGNLDAAVRVLAAEVQQAFKSHVYLRSKH